MKKNLFLVALLTIGLSIQLYAIEAPLSTISYTPEISFFQKIDSVKRDSTSIPKDFESSTSTTSPGQSSTLQQILPQFSPLSPSAASIQKFGDYQVSLATGLPEISIPIHIIEEGNIKVPITLDYHAAGFKLNEQAAWVGLGWALNYGPTLNRTVQSLADDSPSGYFRNPFSPTRDFCNSTVDFNFGLSALQNQIDTQPDIFSYKLSSGKTPKVGRFLLGANGSTPFRIPDYSIQIIPQSSTSSIPSFELINDDGYSYIFGGSTANESLSINSGFSTQNYISSWLISEIRSPNSDDKVSFTYQNGGSQFSQERQWVASSLFNAIPQSGGNYTNSQSITPTSITSSSTVNQRNPNIITFNNGKIEFIQSNSGERLDLPNSHFLKEIRIFSTENSQEVLRKVIKFSYGYFTHISTGQNKRLRLTKVSFQNPTGTVIEEYIPEYWTNTLSWDENTDREKIDFYGYFNGQPNAHLIAVSQYNGVPVLGGAANRATVSTYMKNGVLKKITYPSGGYTEFDYEPNQANFGSGAQLVGGLRVTSIKSTTGNSSFIKRYQYGLSGNSIGNFTTNWTPNSAISPNIQQLIYVGSQQGFPVTSRASMASFTQNGPSLEMNTMDSAPVYYTHVTEYQEDSSDPVKNGRIEYVFDFRVDLISNNFSFVSRDVQPWKRGNLISKTTYSNNNQILHKLENTYQELKASTQVRGGSVLTAHVYEGPLVPRSTIPCPTTFLTSPPGESGGVNPEMSFTGISYQSGINLVTQTIETLDGLATKKSMSYNAHLAISESFIEGSITGESRGDVFKYSSDPTFSGIASINSLVNRNQMTEIIEKETREVINGVTSVLYKEKTNYGSFTGTNGRGQNTLILPTDIQVAPTGGILETRIIFSSYDPTGNLTSYQVDKIPFVVLYGYSNSLVQAVIRNASLAQVTTALQQNGINSAAYSVSTLNTTQLTNIRNFQNSLSGSLTEWYTHIPHVGLSQRVSSNGLRTNFFYNDFLRLTKITDEDGNIDRIYQYQISPTQTFIQTVSPLKPLNTESLAQQTSNSLIDIQYFDGLGRPTQQIGVNQSPTLFSIVKSFIQYDKFNRPSISFLPTPLTTGGSQQQTSIQTNASSFYNDTRPFSSTTYEASPTNRPIQVLGVGNAWESNNKTTTIEYTSAGNNVRRYQIQSNNTVLLNGNYPANSLAQKKIIDEQGHATIEIYDRYSRLIQRQVQVDNTSYLTTAYCYDGLGRVRAVVTPTIFNQNQSIIVSSTSFSDGVYAYEYDSRGRIQRKHVPGAGWTNYVYDLVDQVVLEQTPEQGISGRWSYTMYDAFSRITSQGELTNSSSQVTLQSLFNQVVSPFETWNSTTKTYSKGSFPSSVVTNNEQEVLFYDQYDWVTDANLNYSTVAQINGQGYWSNSRGNPTGGHVRSSVNSSSPILPLVLYYDKKNRLIQKHQGHVAGGNTPAQFPLTTNYEYNHDGTVSKELTKYNFESLPPLNVQTNNTFDFSARLTSILHGINSSPDSLWKISYDEIGRVNKKQLSGTAQPLQLRLKALLQMPVLQIQSDSLMSDALRVGNNGVSLIPLNPPTVVPFNQIITPVGPISPSVLTAGNGGPDSIVDWVMVELRSDTNMCARVDARAALIQRDGDVVDIDGTSPVSFSSVPIGNYYVILRHRNHLGVMSANPITFPQNNVLDFRQHSTPTYSISTTNPLPAQINLSSQFRAAWGGDANGDGSVNYNLDAAKIYITVIDHPNNSLGLQFYEAYGYSSSDINFDKFSIFRGSDNDVNFIENTVRSYPANIFSSLHYSIRQQLPTCPNLTTVSFVSSENSTSQQVDYSWHIRGGLRGINLDPSGNVALNTTQKDVFSYRLDYETAGQWDGNISKQTWLSSDQPVSRSFTFAYDPSKRLTQAIYNGSSGENFTVDQLTYDANSQIKTLRRFGAPGGGVLDNLSYTHQGMRLSQVSDAQTNTFGGFIPRGQGNYSYNSFGQLTSDQNEQIQQISYDSYLKLPTQVVLTDGRRIEYYYSGAGELIKTEYFSAAGQSLERWEYVGDLVLRNGALFQVAVPDGRAVFASGTWNYELHYTDHLGNVRASINRQGQLISSSHFDPWGHRLQGLGTTATQLTNRWELQGKERDLTFGLNRINFGARVYNPTIGVWDQVDPLAEKYTNLSPYQYVANNPLRFIDPDGRETWDVWGATTFSGYAGDDGSGTIVGRTPGKEGNEDPGKGQKKPEGKTEKKRWDHGLVPVYSSYLDGKEAESRGDYASMVGHSFVAALEFVSMALTYGESGIVISGVRQGVVKGAAKGGMTDLQLVTRAAQKAETAIGGTGRFAGTAKHTYANNLLSRYQSIYGNRGLQFNQYFNGPAGRGFLDVVNHRTMTIYDYKFGSAVMGNSQFLKYSNSFPGYGIQIIRP